MLHEATSVTNPVGPVPLDRILIIEVAATVKADPRTVRKEIREPDSVKGIVGDKIRRELRARGVR